MIMQLPFDLTHVIVPEEGGYHVICPELNVSTQGASYAHASLMLQEAEYLFLEDLDETIIKQTIAKSKAVS